MKKDTINKKEIDKFSKLADEWWDPEGKFKPLHNFNPVRLRYIKDTIIEKFGTKWNISLFHYRNIGSAYGNILIGIEDPNTNKRLLIKHLEKCDTPFTEESNNKAYIDFLR